MANSSARKRTRATDVVDEDQQQVIKMAMTSKRLKDERLRGHEQRSSRLSPTIWLGLFANPSFCAVGQGVGVHHQTVQRCVERALSYGPLAAIEDRPRPGKEPVITPEAKAWLVSLACDKAKEHGYPHELWTTRLLARHAREHGPTAGHECLATFAPRCARSSARRKSSRTRCATICVWTRSTGYVAHLVRLDFLLAEDLAHRALNQPQRHSCPAVGPCSRA